MAADNASRESDHFLSYRPTDPRLRDSPALAHLQQFILQVGAQAFGSGTSLSLVRSRLSEHQTQFDAFLGTLDGLFRPRDADLTTAMLSNKHWRGTSRRSSGKSTTIHATFEDEPEAP